MEMWPEVWAWLLAVLFWWLSRRATRFQRMIDKFQGPIAYPILGCVPSLGWSSTDLHESTARLSRKYKWQPYRMWVGPLRSFIVLNDPENIEIVVGKYNMLEKGYMYDFLIPWLGKSVFMCEAEKWRARRKLLAPTFHSKILEGFVDVFHAKAEIFARKMQKEVDGPAFDVFEYVTLCAMDIISETALGVQMNAQDGCGPEYLEAIHDQVGIFMKRSMNPFLFPDILFNLSPEKKIHDRSLKVLTDLTNKVIATRREEMLKAKESEAHENQDKNGVKKRLVFMDLLLIESSSPGSQLTDEIIREEVSTFFFAGFGTASTATCCTLWLLSWHQDIQDKAYQEVEAAFLEGDGVLNFRILQDMKYLERVVKESLRLYPSGPYFARELTDDVTLKNGKVAPQGSTIIISAASAHRNPEIFPDPEKFDPDRFLPENCMKRHPYSFLAFSVGPRNCIGNKYATLEMKTLISHVLRRYRVLPDTETPSLRLADELTLISKSGFPIKLVPREGAHKTGD